MKLTQMNYKFLMLFLALGTASSSYAQLTDGKTKSLIKAESELEKEIGKTSGAEAMAKFSSSTATIFQPNAEVAKTYLNTQKKAFSDLKRTVNYANISKGGDFGITSGQYEMKDGKTPIYGDYLTVWKVNGAEGVWKIEADIETEHQKTAIKSTNKFLEGTDKFSDKNDGLPNATEAAKIVQTTESTFAVMLKTYGVAAFSEFAAKDVRLLYPSNEPIIGKENLIHFFKNMVSTMELTNKKVDIAKAGDLAYTYGTAAFQYKIDLKEALNYMAVWELQDGHKWNIIQLVFIPAVR